MSSQMDFDSLPDVVLSRLVAYLEPSDCLSLVDARISEGIVQAIQRKRCVSFSGSTDADHDKICQYLTRLVIPDRVRVLDFANCRRLADYVIIQIAITLAGLEELHVDDTQLTVMHLPHIFFYCRKISTLSMTVDTHDWKRLNDMRTERCDILKKALAQVTKLKLTWLEQDEAWLVVIKLLSWCQKCSNLRLEPYFKALISVSGRYVEYARKNLFPELGWMTNLKSLVYVKRGSVCWIDYMIRALCDWICDHVVFKHLKHLWIQSESVTEPAVPRIIKSIRTGNPLSPELKNCHQLTQVGNVRLSCVHRSLRLTYFDGDLSIRELHTLCKSFPLLEHLVVRINSVDVSGCAAPAEDLAYGWILPRLRVFFCYSTIDDNDFTSRLAELMPNVEDVRLEHGSTLLNLHVKLDVFPRLKDLRKLSITGTLSGPPSDIYQILMKCCRLESLRIKGTHKTNQGAFLNILGLALPMARRLLEFHLAWCCGKAADFLTIREAVKKCRGLRCVAIEPITLRDVYIPSPSFVPPNFD